MIHGNSKDPVLIKKIALKVWRLRDEVETVIRDKLAPIKEKPEEVKTLLDTLSSEYESSESPGGEEESSEVVSQDDLETGEDEMAAAIAAQEAGEDPAADEEAAKEAEEATELSEEDTAAADMAAAMLEGQGASEEIPPTPVVTGNQIIQRRPEIIEGRTYGGKTILAEVNMQFCYFFCSESFMEGENIVLDFLVPNRFVINGEVLYCRTYNMKSRIISANRLPYRIAVRWSFLKPGERTLLRQFVESIEPDIQEEEAPAPKTGGGGGGDDDDFDEFDELDL